jgi:hypothetical protein
MFNGDRLAFVKSYHLKGAGCPASVGTGVFPRGR